MDRTIFFLTQKKKKLKSIELKLMEVTLVKKQQRTKKRTQS